MRKRLISLVLFIMLFLVSFSSLTFAAEVTVKGVGTTQNDALSDALRNAVELAVGTLVDSETLVQNAAVVRDEIYTKSQGFVRDYSIVNIQPGNPFIVTARVVVDTNPDSSLLSRLQMLKLIEVGLRDPRIAVIIPEYYNNYYTPYTAAETAVIDKLRTANFNRVLDANQINEIRHNDIIKNILSGNTQEAINLATSYQVDYLIVGEASSKRFGHVMGSDLISSRATINGKIFKADTGEIIAAKSFQASGVDITGEAAAEKALTKSGELLGDYLVKKMLEYARNPEKGLKLVVKGLDSNYSLQTLERELRSIRGIKNVYVRGYNDGTAYLDLNYTGSAQTLASELERLPSLRLMISSTSSSVVQAIQR